MANARQLVPAAGGFVRSPYGLLATPGAVDWRSPGDPHWRNGITWEPLCGAGGTTYGPCLITGTGDTAAPPDLAATWERQIRAATSFVVFDQVDCSPVGFSFDEARRDVLEALNRSEQAQVEFAFWTGQAGGGTVVFPHLAADGEVLDPDDGALMQPAAVEVTGGTASFSRGWSELEEAAVECLGGLAVIHAPVDVVNEAARRGLLRVDGGALRTYNGSWVISGAGYPGTSPAGAEPAAGTSWAYATGPLMGYRGEAEVFDPRESFDRSTNTLHMIAQRPFLLGWDCCLFAALLTFDTD